MDQSTSSVVLQGLLNTNWDDPRRMCEVGGVVQVSLRIFIFRGGQHLCWEVSSAPHPQCLLSAYVSHTI